LEKLNISKLLYHIEKGDVDPSQKITMHDLFKGGVLSKIQYGVKLLGKGADDLSKLGIPLNIEVTDASKEAIEAVKASGGSISSVYRTPLILRQHLKPHRYPHWMEYKIPMPKPKDVYKLEALKEKGLEVWYPRAPWYNDNVDQLKEEAQKREERIKNSQYAEFLEKLPADRSEGVGRGKVRKEKQDIPSRIIFNL